MIINPEALEAYKEVMEDEADAFIADILESFYNNSADLIETLEKSIPTNDRKSFIRAAHTFKSTSATVGAESLSGLAADLEMKAHSEALTALTPLVAALKEAFAEAEIELKKLYN